MHIYTVRPTGLNIGNQLIQLALRSQLFHLFGHEASIHTIPATEKDVSRGNGAGLSAKTVYEINSHANSLIVGGGNLFENGELTVDINALKSLSVPSCVFSVSYGRIYGRDNKLIARTDCISDETLIALSRFIKQIGCRDQATFDKLHNLNIANKSVVGCPTIHLSNYFSLENTSSSSSREFALQDTCIISLRSLELVSVKPSLKWLFYKTLDNAIDHIKRRGLRPLLLCHDRRDLTFAELFAEKAENIYEEDINHYLHLITSCKLLISMRLHSFIPRCGFGLPSINLIYDERAQSLSEYYGLDPLCVSILEMDPSSKITSLIDDMIIGNTLKVESILSKEDLSQNLTDQLAFLKTNLNNEH